MEVKSMPTQILNLDPTSISTISFLFDGDDTAVLSDCNGSIEVETETTTKSKTCGGQVIKEITKPTKMTVTVSAHVPVEIFRRVYGIKHDETLKTGVYSYGKGSVGEKFAMAAELVDEFEDNTKLISFLNSRVQSALTFTIDSSEDEITPLEIVITASQDELGYWYHDAIEAELDPAEGLTKEIWLNSLTPDQLKKVPASGE